MPLPPPPPDPSGDGLESAPRLPDGGYLFVAILFGLGAVGSVALGASSDDAGGAVIGGLFWGAIARQAWVDGVKRKRKRLARTACDETPVQTE